MSEWISEEAAQIGGGGSGRYVKAKDWPQKKDAKVAIIRILSSVFAFYEGWSGKKPIRASREQDFAPGIAWDEQEFRGKKSVQTPKKCWGVYCYYHDKPEEILFWQITQYSVQQALIDLAEGPKGPPTTYPVMVTYRESAKPPYSVQGLDKEPVNPVAEKAYKELLAAGAKLEGILTSEGPFPRRGAPAPSPVADGGIPF